MAKEQQFLLKPYIKLYFLYICGVLTLSGYNQTHSTTPLLSKTRGRKYNKRLMGREKERERSLTTY